MSDSVSAEYRIDVTTGDWLHDLVDLVDLGLQAREVLRRHRWLVELVATRSTIGPNGVRLIKHVLLILRDQTINSETKLELFAMLSGIAALFVKKRACWRSRFDAASGRIPDPCGRHRRVPLLNEVLAREPAMGSPRSGVDRFA